MTLGRQIFETTIGKIILPWLNLGFIGALCTVATELMETARVALRP
jgi:hypothetical protein